MEKTAAALGAISETVFLLISMSYDHRHIASLCWVHAERLVHKLDTFTDEQREAQTCIRRLIWLLYGDLKAYRQNPSRQRSPPRFSRRSHSA
jgi:hypothetical protein